MKNQIIEYIQGPLLNDLGTLETFEHITPYWTLGIDLGNTPNSFNLEYIPHEESPELTLTEMTEISLEITRLFEEKIADDFDYLESRIHHYENEDTQIIYISFESIR